MPLYHTNIFLPKKVRGLVPFGEKVIQYSHHAMREANKDGIDKELPKSIDILADCSIIEIEVMGNKLRKVVARKKLSQDCDIVLVVSPTDNRKVFCCRTVWVNKVDDNHRTLDDTPYVKKGQR